MIEQYFAVGNLPAGLPGRFLEKDGRMGNSCKLLIKILKVTVLREKHIVRDGRGNYFLK